MRKIIFTIILAAILVCDAGQINAAVDDNRLHSISAVVMDADTGRVLYGKNECEERANASTTKIMTLILALEYGEMDSLVTISPYAAKMPDVQMNIEAGDQYYFKDLLYSMMLESHNDSAVAVAEAVGGDVERFAKMMNDKAGELGMSNTYFITPNGLDASDENGKHHTTAYDLALLMRYCIMDSPKKEEFIDICQTRDYTLKDYTGNKLFVLKNRNRLLDMLDGVIAGKTGFTGDAGYCYVTAITNDGNTYVIALLGCGWPNNRNYKWEDTKLLYRYVKDNYTRQELLSKDYRLKTVRVSDGIEADYIDLYGEYGFDAIISSRDIVSVKLILPDCVRAPVYEGDIIGTIEVYINQELFYSSVIYSGSTVHRKDCNYYLKRVLGVLFL